MKVMAKKQGRVCTVYIDSATGQPLPLASFEDEPMGFPFTTNEQELRAKYAGAEIIFLEQQRPPNPEATALVKLSPEQMEHEIAKIKSGSASAPPVTKAPPPIPNDASQAILEALHASIVAELRTLFARYGEATGKRKVQLKTELGAICNFIIKIQPAYIPVLDQMKAELDAPRFEL